MVEEGDDEARGAETPWRAGWPPSTSGRAAAGSPAAWAGPAPLYFVREGFAGSSTTPASRR